MILYLLLQKPKRYNCSCSNVPTSIRSSFRYLRVADAISTLETRYTAIEAPDHPIILTPLSLSSPVGPFSSLALFSSPAWQRESRLQQALWQEEHRTVCVIPGGPWETRLNYKITKIPDVLCSRSINDDAMMEARRDGAAGSAGRPRGRCLGDEVSYN